MEGVDIGTLRRIAEMRRLAIVVDGNRVAIDCATEVMAVAIVVPAEAIPFDLE